MNNPASAEELIVKFSVKSIVNKQQQVPHK